MRIAPASLLLIAMTTAACGDRGASSDGSNVRKSGPATTTSTRSADTLSLAERRATGGRIVFVSERSGAPQVYTIAPAGEGERRLATGPGAGFPAALSPDGRTLAAVAVREQGGDHGEQLVVVPLDGGAAHPLGPASSRARSPSWSPDGRWLVFESDRESFRDLYRINLDGSGLRRLTENREGNFDPAVSPDGRRIAFVSSRDGDSEVYVMNADGSAQRRLTAFYRDDMKPGWSPDGRTISFISNRLGADRVFLVGADGTNLRRLNAADTTRTGQEADIAWSPDGSRIAYTLQVAPGASRIRIVDVRTGKALEVAGGEGASQPAWSPDGRLLAFTAGTAADADLWIARADGTAPTRITRAPGADWLPRWGQ